MRIPGTGVATDFHAAAEAAGLTLETRIAPDLPSIDMENSPVWHILGNLLCNAIKYTPAVGGSCWPQPSSRDGAIPAHRAD